MTDTAPMKPIRDCYWVKPGGLLAGEYPGARRPAEGRERLCSFLRAGVQVFIDLTEAEGHLEPYAGLLADESERLGVDARHLRFEIPDMGAPSEEYLREILGAIDAALAADHTAYVHCWGGRGRTGTVIGAWLVEHGMSGEQALAHITELRRDIPDGWKASPETPEQCKLVRCWRPAAR